MITSKQKTISQSRCWDILWTLTLDCGPSIARCLLFVTRITLSSLAPFTCNNSKGETLCLVFYSLTLAEIEQASEKGGERRRTPGVSIKLRRSGERVSQKGKGGGEKRNRVFFRSPQEFSLLLIFALPPSQFRFLRVSFWKRLLRMLLVRWLSFSWLLSLLVMSKNTHMQLMTERAQYVGCQESCLGKRDVFLRNFERATCTETISQKPNRVIETEWTDSIVWHTWQYALPLISQLEFCVCGHLGWCYFKRFSQKMNYSLWQCWVEAEIPPLLHPIFLGSFEESKIFVFKGKQSKKYWVRFWATCTGTISQKTQSRDWNGMNW